MDIKLIDGNWLINDKYVITGNVEEGYEVHTVSQYGDPEETEALYENKSFESCLIWCWNS